MAAAKVDWAQDVRSASSSYHSALSDASLQMTMLINISLSAHSLTAQVIDLPYIIAVADADKQWTIDLAEALGTLTVDLATAQANKDRAGVGAEVVYQNTKALAERDLANHHADSRVVFVGADAAAWAERNIAEYSQAAGNVYQVKLSVAKAVRKADEAAYASGHWKGSRSRSRRGAMPRSSPRVRWATQSTRTRTLR